MAISLAAISTAFWLALAALAHRNERALAVVMKLAASVLLGLLMGAMGFAVVASSDPWFQNQFTEMTTW